MVTTADCDFAPGWNPMGLINAGICRMAGELFAGFRLPNPHFAVDHYTVIREHVFAVRAIFNVGLRSEWQATIPLCIPGVSKS